MKREIDEMGYLESPGGPPIPETGGRNSEFSRSRLGVEIRRGGQPLHPERREVGQQGREVRYLKSNGWADETAVLQLFAHLEGEALNMALLMPEGERANREGLSQGISNYYCSPGRLAVLRRKFESVTCRTGADPATFTTELEILAVRGFGDMGTCARNRMVRDRFIADQRSCGLRRHLDSVPPHMPIWEIVDRCRVWESHSEQKSGCNQDVPPGIMPSLIARLLRAAQEDNPAEVKVPPNTRARRPSVALDAVSR